MTDHVDHDPDMVREERYDRDGEIADWYRAKRSIPNAMRIIEFNKKYHALVDYNEPSNVVAYHTDKQVLEQLRTVLTNSECSLL